MKRAWLLCLLLGCEHDPKHAGQSFTAAIQLICDAPAQADSAYWKANLKNTDAIELFETMGNLGPADRQQRLTAALAKANLTTCRRFDPLPLSFPYAPVVTAAPGALAYDASAPVIHASKRAIVIDDKALVGLAHGVPDPKDLEGTKLPRVASYLEVLGARVTKGGGSRPRLEIEIDPQLPYSLLVDLISSAKVAGWRELGIVVVVGTTPMLIPISLPDAKAFIRNDPKRATAEAAPLGMMLWVKPAELDLWSTSGQEGTLQRPVAAATQATAIAVALGDVVARHWPAGTKRPEGTQTIVVMADGSTRMQQIVDALSVIRLSTEGGELFPDVQLGFAL
jgi:biopolymer transport protein ExbD